MRTTQEKGVHPCLGQSQLLFQHIDNSLVETLVQTINLGVVGSRYAVFSASELEQTLVYFVLKNPSLIRKKVIRVVKTHQLEIEPWKRHAWKE